MKIRNKDNGEIVDLCEGFLGDECCGEYIIIKPVAFLNKEYRYDSWEKFISEWEEYKEPEGYWYIRDGGNIDYSSKEFSIAERHKKIGNYFKTEEEAKAALQSLKAWKRLKDKGFRFTFYDTRSGSENNGKIEGEFVMFSECDDPVDKNDLDLLFGGEE